ncbi:unnamed protein product [Dracunculus medinensis]|uniref:Endo/exonuclease/phosphatase domain-containing protein n=1 Tax=Dracunculus medinensis TaxID=318479 RepID=A0A0N4UBS8_DRAME|nr:unnamed protein product [Dracunculus medinensis]
MAYTRFKGKFCNISVISVYTPTLSADDRDKDKFYVELQLLTKSLPKHDMVIIGGDWNARVGHIADVMTSTIGKYGIGDRCANGERLRYADMLKSMNFLLLILASGIIKTSSHVELSGQPTLQRD